MILPFAKTYRSILRNIFDHGVSEFNARTGSKIIADPTGVSFCIDLFGSRFPTCGLRKTHPHIAAAELAWCLRGENHINWLKRHTKVWDTFATETNGHFYLWEAYGWRWRKAFDLDQIDIAIRRLRKDSTDRRVWISSWDPRADIDDVGQKTVPCPVGFTLSIIDGKLNSALMIRSSDLYHGLPHDVMRHALFMSAFGENVGALPGYMRVTLAHPHVYERHWKLCREMITQHAVVPPLSIPQWSCDEIVKYSDEYVDSVKRAGDQLVWPAFNPKSEVVK